MANELESLFDRLRVFRGGWVSRGWSWDRRFTCVASTFGTGEAEEALRLVTTALPVQWTSTSLPKAPLLIAEIAEETGGVRSDQLLFASPESSVMGYGLWWPWGGLAGNISMRVGITGRISDADMMSFRQVFGALDD